MARAPSGPKLLPLSLFAAGEPAVSSEVSFVRRDLDPCCWVDYAEGFLCGADQLLAYLETAFVWERGRRLMYGTWYDEPRLTARLELGASCVPEVVRSAAEVLGQHYERRFSGLFCNYYQDGQNSVAWHADRIGQTRVDPLVAIISLGGPRTFAMREQGRSEAAARWSMHSGDLLVMGGATQHHWEHAIPKIRLAPPRMSLTTRAG